MNHRRWSEVGSFMAAVLLFAIYCSGNLSHWFNPLKVWMCIAVAAGCGFMWAAGCWSDAAGRLASTESKLRVLEAEKARRIELHAQEYHAEMVARRDAREKELAE